MTPEIEAAVERHTAHMMALRSHFKGAAEAVSQQVKNGSMSRKDGAAKVRTLYENHVAQVRLGEAGLPNPDGKVTEIATACPWCEVIEEVVVEKLPEDKTEPDFEQAVAVREFVSAQMKASEKQGA